MTQFQALRLRQKVLLQSVAKEREMKQKKRKENQAFSSQTAEGCTS
jgi:hypothetical protein